LTGFQGPNSAVDEDVDAHLGGLLADRIRPVQTTAIRSRRIEEEINRLLQRHREYLAEEILEAVMRLTPDGFEQLCRVILEKLEFENVERVGAQFAGTLGDGGVDLRARLSQQGLPPLDVLVQAKRQRGNVGPGPIQQLRGALRAGQQGIFITTSRFTQRAVEEAAADGRTAIGTLDGPMIADLLAKFGVAVRSRVVNLDRFEPRLIAQALADNDAQ
jgi:restriction system protein